MVHNHPITAYPFEALADYVDAEVLLAKSRIEEANLVAFQDECQALEQNLSRNSESGSYEGNVSDEYNLSVKPVTLAQLSVAATKAADIFIEAKFFPTKRQKVNFDFAAVDDYIYRNMKLIASASDPKLISGSKTIRAFKKESRFNTGIYYFYNLASRSALVSPQTDPRFTSYCALVPLFMSVFKVRGYGTRDSIPYSSWDREDLGGIVPATLRDAMLEEIPILTKERVLELRKKIFMRSGKPTNPDTTYVTYFISDTELRGLTNLSVHMAIQSWCASAHTRNNKMILDPMNWDAMPEAYITTEVSKPVEGVILKKKRAPITVTTNDIPWDDI